MSTSDGTFSGRSNHILRLTVSYSGSQSVSGNYSTVNWSLQIIRTSGTGSWYLDNGGNWSVNIGGHVINGGAYSYDTRSNTTKTLGSGSVNIGHDAEGNGSSNSYGSTNAPGTIGSASAGPGRDTYPFIPKQPGSPGAPELTAPTLNTIAASWVAASNGGSPITSYLIRYADNSTMNSASDIDTGSSSVSHTITGLTPGKTYWVQVAAQNQYGISSYSATRSVVVPNVPSAPGTPSITTPSPSSIAASWVAPANGGSAISSYRLRYADNSTMSDSTVINTTSTATTRTISGLAPGRIYWVQVAAVNAQGASDYSPAASVQVGIGGRRWGGSSEAAFSAAMRWNGTEEVAISVAMRWNGTEEVPLS